MNLNCKLTRLICGGLLSLTSIGVLAAERTATITLQGQAYTLLLNGPVQDAAGKDTYMLTRDKGTPNEVTYGLITGPSIPLAPTDGTKIYFGGILGTGPFGFQKDSPTVTIILGNYNDQKSMFRMIADDKLASFDATNSAEVQCSSDSNAIFTITGESGVLGNCITLK